MRFRILAQPTSEWSCMSLMSVISRYMGDTYHWTASVKYREPWVRHEDFTLGVNWHDITPIHKTEVFA